MQRTQHHSLITILHTKTLALAKIVQRYPRKHRDLLTNGVLQDAVDALEEFKEVEWPPRRHEMDVVLERVPSWLADTGDGDNCDSSDVSGGALVTDVVDDDALGGVVDDDRGEEEDKGSERGDIVVRQDAPVKVIDSNSSNEYVTGIKDERAKMLHEDLFTGVERGNNTDTTSENLSGDEYDLAPDNSMQIELAIDDDDIVVNEKPLPSTAMKKYSDRNNISTPGVDAAAMEPMHPAVITTLHALCIVVSSESKTLKMAELALECITILTNGRYVSGVAGGRFKLEVQRKNGDDQSATITHQHHQQTEQSATAGHDGRDAGLSFLGYVIESITRASDLPSESVQGGMAKALLAVMTCPKCGVHEAAMLQAVRSTFHVYLVGKSPAGKELARSTLVDILKYVFMRMEAYDIVIKSSCGGTTVKSIPSADQSVASGEDFVGAFSSQYHTDSYLLFRALCKLSSKTLPGDENALQINTPGSAMGGNFFSSTPIVDPLALNSKILSMELILVVLEHCGDAFRTGEKFVYAVRSYLCVSLLKNCMSNQTVVAHLSLKIFLLLVRNFKTHLKAEIEVFVANIFLRVLESPNSPFEQKVLVLEALRALCADPQMLTQLFLNYDCDFDAVNLYKEIVHHVTRISAKACAPKLTGGSGNTSKKSADQELDLSRAGLEVLVVILRSFLKSLGLPGGDDVFDELDGTSSLSKLRESLKIEMGDDSTMAISDTERQSSNKGSNTSFKRKENAPSRFDHNFSGESSDVADKIVDVFDKKRTRDQNFAIGRVKFKLDFKDGLKFFIENGVVKLDALDIARFLYSNSEELDKTQVGEVLGKEIDAAFVNVKDLDPDMGGKGFYLRVLCHYVDIMDLTGLMFDDAIRTFLSGFRLPGEAQKIDRIMEKFAERFTSQNESVFPSPDTAFILGFSVIMLNTDLHNPSIKDEKRMTMESFIRNNKGIADGDDLPEEFLVGIFNRIKEKPFSLKEDDEAREKVSKESTFDSLFIFEGPTLFGPNAEEKRREKFRKEREEMMSASEQLFKKRPSDKNSSKKVPLEFTKHLTDSVSPADVAKPMFDVTWGPLIGTLSQVLESSSNEKCIALCLSGFVYSIRISSYSSMSLALNTFVNSLAKFTTLGSIKEMKKKNIECIRTLLSIAIVDGEYLSESWSPILQCISQLGRLHLFASGLDSQDQFLLVDSYQMTKISETVREMEESNGRAVLAVINEVLIDKVFTSSITLSARGIVSFIEKLIAVSEAEISGDTKKGISGVCSSSIASGSQGGSIHGGIDGPRVFSLQRLVEVADYNMDIRPRLTWSQIWESMGNHFARVGCNENAIVSMFAIDALRQLSFKFLEKPELTDFNFQRLFLKPFLLIMENPGSREDIRELVLRCVDNIIRTLAHHLRSGWKIFFSILMLASRDQSVKINTLGLAVLQRLLDDHLEVLCPSGNMEAPGTDDNLDQPDSTLSSSVRSIRNANADDFVWLCRASLSFVQIEGRENPLPIGLTIRALCHTACYADLIADRKILPPVSGCHHCEPSTPGYTYEGLTNDESLEMVIWRPLFDGLAAGIGSPVSSISRGGGCLVQRGSAMALRAILLRHGKLFSVPQWSTILSEVILPAVQIGAESDSSPVTKIVSESPSISSLDFVGEPLALPPLCDDEGLQKFAAMSSSGEITPRRPFGFAELLTEVSFTDLRHGGDGNLSNAYSLKLKDVERRCVHLQPFPDSWIATTAPIAIGLLSDIIYLHLLDLGTEAREVLWPIMARHLARWSVGAPQEKYQNEARGGVAVKLWQPCEALVRISCKEWSRVFFRVLDFELKLSKSEAQAWLNALSSSLGAAMLMNIYQEEKIREDIIEAKVLSLGQRQKWNSLLGMISMLKIRCIASHCLQQYMSLFLERFAALADGDEISFLLDTLSKSQLASILATKDEDLAHAFQEAFLNQFGDGVSVDEGDATLHSTNGGSGHHGSSHMFFLSQEASATKALIILLNSCSEKIKVKNLWSSEALSEPLLIKKIMDVLYQFLESEEKDGFSIDTTQWRSASESRGQSALYCTTFAGVVVTSLNIILKLEEEKFFRHKHSLFPILCSLIRVKSAEIRHLVSDIFRRHIGPRLDFR